MQDRGKVYISCSDTYSSLHGILKKLSFFLHVYCLGPIKPQARRGSSIGSMSAWHTRPAHSSVETWS